MILKRFALRIMGVLCACLVTGMAMSQSVLPNISGSADKGIVLLSWTCQYTGIKSISVLHSTDSISNYKTIGNVKKLEKGVQAYVDGHPDTGRNYYKLNVIFASGLTWTSNRRMVYIDISKLDGGRLVLPRNDSLQRFIVTEELHRPEPVSVPHYEVKKDSEAMQVAQRMQGGKVSLVFDADAADIAGNSQGADKPAVRKRITISFDEPDMTTALFIRSAYIYADPVSGHVKIELPDDVRRHSYTVKFYDQRNNVVVDIPRINAGKIVVDKRNFQRKGQYKFILRKDTVELERGYVNLAL